METQNANTEANVSAAAIARDFSTVQGDAAGETAGSTTEGVTPDAAIVDPLATEPKPSYVKLAMRNMVRKRGLSLWHFTLTTIGLLAFLVGLSYITR